MIPTYSNGANARHQPPFAYVFRKGAVVFNEGDRARHWFEVDCGMVRTCRFGSNGCRQLTGFHVSGDVFGLDEERYEETAEAVTDVKLIAYPLREREPNCGSSHQPETRIPLRRAWENARRCIFLLGRKTAAARVAAFLISLRDRFGEDGLTLPMSRGDIGDHLGLALHTVSRTISDFSRRGFIELHGPQSIRILDPDSLRTIAGEEEPIGSGRTERETLQSSLTERTAFKEEKDGGNWVPAASDRLIARRMRSGRALLGADVCPNDAGTR